MTNEEAMRHLHEATPLALVARVLEGEMGRMEQAFQQRRAPTPVEAKRMILEGTERILAKAEEVGLVSRARAKEDT